MLLSSVPMSSLPDPLATLRVGGNPDWMALTAESVWGHELSPRIPSFV